MNIVFRPGTPADINACGIICYEAFKAIAEQHNFPPDFPAPESGIGILNYLLSGMDNSIYSVIAEADGQIVGSNFLWEHRYIAGVGPITVDPKIQNSSIGRKLMENVLERSEEKKITGVRLVQAAYHNRSFSLYSKLGFDVQEQLSALQGPALNISFPGFDVRPATEQDVDACNQLCYRVHGLDRREELTMAIKTGTASVVEYNGEISGYTTGVGFMGHTVAATNTELKALIGAATIFSGPGFLLPARNSEVLRWCLANGLRVMQPLTLMSKGLYNQPAGAFIPSVLY